MNYLWNVFINRRKRTLRKGAAMKFSQRIGFLLFLFSQSALCGLALNGTIKTYAGPGLPANGAQAIA
jgi:hypothetical protein